MKKNALVKIVPINLHHTDSKIKDTLLRLDGVIFTGGSISFYKKITKENLLEIENKMEADSEHQGSIGDEQDIRVYSRYMRKLKMITTFSKELYDTRNIKLPMYGVCLGNQMLLATQARSNFRLNPEIDRKNFTALHLKKNVKPRPFERFISKYLKHTYTKPRFFMSHVFGVSLEAVEKDELLKSSVNIVTTSMAKVQKQELSNSHLITESELDSRMDQMKIILGHYSEDYIINIMQKVDVQISNGEYVSMFEMKHYPIFGVQFHPEKTLHDFFNGGFDIPSVEIQLTNEMIPLFFLNQVFTAKIGNLRISGQGICQFESNSMIYSVPT